MAIIKSSGTGTWDGIPTLAYKEEGSHFKSITRQTLFEGSAELPAELRYFEIAPGGHSTLERHVHLHVVMILKGNGRALVGDTIYELKPHDLVEIPAQTWHQFQASVTESFGFLCIVNIERDRPLRPNDDELQKLKENPAVAKFIRI